MYDESFCFREGDLFDSCLNVDGDLILVVSVYYQSEGEVKGADLQRTYLKLGACATVAFLFCVSDILRDLWLQSVEQSCEFARIIYLQRVIE